VGPVEWVGVTCGRDVSIEHVREGRHDLSWESQREAKGMKSFRVSGVGDWERQQLGYWLTRHELADGTDQRPGWLTTPYSTARATRLIHAAIIAWNMIILSTSLNSSVVGNGNHGCSVQDVGSGLAETVLGIRDDDAMG
jgi:hypothetical protein